MSKLFEVKIALAITSTNLNTGEHYIVSLDENNLMLPYLLLDKNQNILHLLSTLVERYINLDSSWVVQSLMSTMVEEDSITILYKCTIPLDTELKENCIWLPVWKCINSIMLKEIVRE